MPLDLTEIRGPLILRRRRTSIPMGAMVSLAFLGTMTPVQSDGLPRSGIDSLPHYQIDALVHPAHGTIDATVTVGFPPGPPGTERKLILGRSYRISSLSGERALVSSVQTDEPITSTTLITVRATDSLGARVRIRYSGPLHALVTPPLNTVSPSLVELAVDSFWIPYLADLGAPFTVKARVRGLPRGAVAVANVPHRLTDDGFHLESERPTRDLALIAAPGLIVSEDGRFRILASDHGTPLVRYYREHGAASVEFLEGILGPLPGATATVTVVRRPNHSGYARPGYVVVTEQPGTSPGPGQAKFIAHEFAHLWFSRASPISEDYWLVETPAEYLGLRYVEQALGREAVEALIAPKREAAAKAPPMLGKGRAAEGSLYSRGPLLLFELEEAIGREGVDRVLRDIAALPAHDTGLFLDALRRVGGEEVARAFESKLRS